jgi:hypothetical protein
MGTLNVENQGRAEESHDKVIKSKHGMIPRE